MNHKSHLSISIIAHILFALTILSPFLFLQPTLASTLNTSATHEPSLAVTDQLLWGTYKPHLMSSITQRSKYPITLGMAYSKAFLPELSLESFKKDIRFRMNRDIFAAYTHHNGLDFARQAIFDDPNQLFYDIAFLKNFSRGPDIQEWTYKIYGTIQHQEQQHHHHSKHKEDEQPFSTFVYIALEDLEGEGKDLRHIEAVENMEEEDSTVVRVVNGGSSGSEGYFKINVMGRKHKRDHTHTVKGIYRCLVDDVNKTKTWQVEDIIQSRLGMNIVKGITYLDSSKCSESAGGQGTNFFVVQVIADSEFEIIVSYNSKEIPHFERNELESVLVAKEKEFETEVQSKLPIRGLNRYRLDLNEAREIQKFALSNLLGGILHSYGTIKVEQAIEGQDTKTYETEKSELFTASPSRVGFPRGFLWDEGFHQTVLCKWNVYLCIEMMKSWFSTMQEGGWIPREQARGEELESNFKQKEFLYQSPREANPPSMVIAINQLVEIAERNIEEQKARSGEIEEIKSFLKEVLPKLKSWLGWFRETQKSGEEGYYRWGCKTKCNGKYFASGLGDYPRDYEGKSPIGNLDLHMWLLTLTQGILSIEDFLKASKSEETVKIAEVLEEGLKEFGDKKDNLMKDLISQRKGESEEALLGNYRGYVNLFPIFFGGVKTNSSELKAALDMVSSQEQLWTSYGVRSLAKSDGYFVEGDGYWTEPIYIPMNYLLLRGLKKYYSDNEESMLVYKALRENLVKMMSLNWKIGLNFWENYDSFSGIGKGFPNFTGWTSLIALIYAEAY